MRCFRVLLKALLALVLIVLALIGSIIGCVAYQSRTIDRTYATYDDMMDEPRLTKGLGLQKWIPANARDIQCRSTATFGSATASFNCKMTEREFRAFAQEMSYALCTNAFQKLDYGERYNEQGGECFDRWCRKMAETDHERQLKLVFGDGTVPANFLSRTDSHAFDGCHAGLVYRRILVYDLKAGVLYGYAWRNLL